MVENPSLPHLRRAVRRAVLGSSQVSISLSRQQQICPIVGSSGSSMLYCIVVARNQLP